ncbi:hypothetical protein KKA00_02800 [bacterium]|nr:hypothetical protein [bacterium]MBU1651124.1 hypothetical protein [bacterium]MBU1880958.1 hypothetical protein [bacterium]
MFKRTVIWGIVLVLVLSSAGWSQMVRYKWSPRLNLGAGMVVWSPGGEDRNLFESSMGLNVSAAYWFKPKTQLVLSVNGGPLAAREDVWFDLLALEESYDEWDVKGSLWNGSLEIRSLYSAGPKNFMYLGLGADLFYFSTIKASYTIYGTEQPEEGSIETSRDPDFSFGPHLAPGMFFIFNTPIGDGFIDVGVRFNYLIDGDNDNPFWLAPYFTGGLRVF